MRFLSLFLILVSFCCRAQSFDALVTRALAEYKKKDFLSSALTYEAALAINKTGHQTYYNAACSWALAGNAEKAIKYLHASFEKGNKEFTWMYYDRDLTSIRDHPGYLAFEKKYRPANTIFFFDILKALNSNDRAYFVDKTVVLDEYLVDSHSIRDMEKRCGFAFKLAPGDSLIDFSTKTLEFLNCTFENPGTSFNYVRSMAIQGVTFQGCRGSVGLRSMKLNHILVYQPVGRVEKTNIRIENVKLEGPLTIEAEGNRLAVVNSSLKIKIPESGGVPFGDGSYSDFDDRLGMHFHGTYNSIELSNVDIEKHPDENNLCPVDLFFITGKLLMNHVRIGYSAKLRGTIENELVIEDSMLPSHLDMFEFHFPTENVLIPFQQLNKTSFVKIDYLDSGYTMNGDSAKDFANEKFTNQVTSLYKRLYDNYRNRADLNSANACYVSLKDLEIAHLKAKEDKDLEESMRLWLNRLMGFYTNHATSPVRALIVSFYIIVLFAIFYFFFPSEWDKESKAQLAHDFRLFIEKNEHGYVRPFFRMMKGFLQSFANAFTLSLNAFITLGFGNIPTVGLPRYVCVLQGALGWLLLSLFTVALLNQVLL